MHSLIVLVLACFSLSFTASLAAQDSGSFMQVEIDTLDKEEFLFPDDLNAGSLNIVMLAIGTEQDNGTWQGDVLVEWYAALDAAGVLNDETKAWHFSVMKVPFFVKGIIRRGMADTYKGKLPLGQAGPIFVKAEKFARQADIAVDGQPTLVLVTPDGVLHEQFKGEATEENINAVTAAVAAYSIDEAG
jgi:hypothetical protein